jgi:PAS domain S-box-containing protein
MDLSELYREIVESSPDGLWVIDLDGRTVYANPEIARLHRIGDEGLAALTVFDTLDDDGRVRFRAHLDDVREGRVHEHPVEVRWVRSDGTVQWLLCRESALLDDAGRPRALVQRYSANPSRHELVVEPPSKGWILVVEDNAVNQLVATGLLASLGYTTDTADDGLAAIEAARDGAFDAILMDVQMPNMDGYTATRHIRAHDNGRHRPIIAMTAAAVEGERERCLEAGMDDFLVKPVNAAQLDEALRRWLAPRPSYAERLDLDRLEELREVDNPEDESSYVDRAITNFLGSAEGQLATIGAAAVSGNADQLSAVAHRLAGSALNLGAISLGEGAREVEEHVLNGSMAAAVAALPELAVRMAADLEALRAYQRETFPARAT